MCGTKLVEGRGYYVCPNCGLESTEQILVSGRKQMFNQDQYRRNQRKERRHESVLPMNPSVHIRYDVKEDLKVCLDEMKKWGKNTSMVQFVSEAVMIYIDAVRAEMRDEYGRS